MSCAVAESLDRLFPCNPELKLIASWEATVNKGSPLPNYVVKAYNKYLARGRVAGAFLYGPSLFSQLMTPRPNARPFPRRFLERIQRYEAVFVPICNGEEHWSLSIFVRNLKGQGGTLFTVCAMHQTKRVNDTLKILCNQLPNRWEQRQIPCHAILSDSTVSGIRMLHHLHTLLWERFWENTEEGLTLWTTYRGPMDFFLNKQK